ncbi:MAG TPA: alkaline phosphatase family protein, partial [Allosphingosinicella sp.]|nr:alkaline phosphatase family protein [Allosphingosinicella sp.]
MAAQQPAARPKLIVAISVDQLSADLFQQYRQYYDGGLKRLSEGVVFPAGYQGHNATETCPGHSTILTGSRPARTGIIANNWFNPAATREDKGVYCSEDPRVPGSSSDKYTVSSFHLRVPALGDHMKRADPRSRTAVVAGKDRAAIMMGGYNPDQRWWW